VLVTPMRTAIVRPAIVLLLAACAARTPARTRVPPDRSIITQREILEHKFETVFDAIQSLRPSWLQTRGTNTLTQTPTQVQVYLDNNHLGGISSLSTISLSSVVYIRHYNGLEATARWGLDHGEGAIYVSTHLEGNIGP
jgi:hypothetical protein